MCPNGNGFDRDSGLGETVLMLNSTEVFDNLNNFVLPKLKDFVNKNGWDLGSSEENFLFFLLVQIFFECNKEKESHFRDCFDLFSRREENCAINIESERDGNIISSSDVNELVSAESISFRHDNKIPKISSNSFKNYNKSRLKGVKKITFSNCETNSCFNSDNLMVPRSIDPLVDNRSGGCWDKTIIFDSVLNKTLDSTVCRLFFWLEFISFSSEKMSGSGQFKNLTINELIRRCVVVENIKFHICTVDFLQNRFVEDATDIVESSELISLRLLHSFFISMKKEELTKNNKKSWFLIKNKAKNVLDFYKKQGINLYEDLGNNILPLLFRRDDYVENREKFRIKTINELEASWNNKIMIQDDSVINEETTESIEQNQQTLKEPEQMFGLSKQQGKKRTITEDESNKDSEDKNGDDVLEIGSHILTPTKVSRAYNETSDCIRVVRKSASKKLFETSQNHKLPNQKSSFGTSRSNKEYVITASAEGETSATDTTIMQEVINENQDADINSSSKNRSFVLPVSNYNESQKKGDVSVNKENEVGDENLRDKIEEINIDSTRLSEEEKKKVTKGFEDSMYTRTLSPKDNTEYYKQDNRRIFNDLIQQRRLAEQRQNEAKELTIISNRLKINIREKIERIDCLNKELENKTQENIGLKKEILDLKLKIKGFEASKDYLLEREEEIRKKKDFLDRNFLDRVIDKQKIQELVEQLESAEKSLQERENNSCISDVPTSELEYLINLNIDVINLLNLSDFLKLNKKQQKAVLLHKLYRAEQWCNELVEYKNQVDNHLEELKNRYETKEKYLEENLKNAQNTLDEVNEQYKQELQQQMNSCGQEFQQKFNQTIEKDYILKTNHENIVSRLNAKNERLLASQKGQGDYVIQLQNTKTDNQRRILELKKKVSVLEAKLINLNTQKQALENTVVSQDSLVSNLEEENQKKNEEILQMSNLKTASEKEISALNIELANAEGLVERLKQEFKESEKERNKLETINNKTQELLNESKKKNNEFKDSILNLEQKNKALQTAKEQVKDLELNLQKINIENQNNKQKILDWIAENSALRHIIESRNQELIKVKEDFKKAKQKEKDLKDESGEKQEKKIDYTTSEHIEVNCVETNGVVNGVVIITANERSETETIETSVSSFETDKDNESKKLTQNLKDSIECATRYKEMFLSAYEEIIFKTEENARLLQEKNKLEETIRLVGHHPTAASKFIRSQKRYRTSLSKILKFKDKGVQTDKTKTKELETQTNESENSMPKNKVPHSKPIVVLEVIDTQTNQNRSTSFDTGFVTANNTSASTNEETKDDRVDDMSRQSQSETADAIEGNIGEIANNSYHNNIQKNQSRLPALSGANDEFKKILSNGKLRLVAENISRQSLHNETREQSLNNSDADSSVFDSPRQGGMGGGSGSVGGNSGNNINNDPKDILEIDYIDKIKDFFYSEEALILLFVVSVVSCLVGLASIILKSEPTVIKKSMFKLKNK